MIRENFKKYLLRDSITDFMFSLQNKIPFDFYFVGGCVRDLVKGNNVSDFDITSSATPQEVLEKCKEKGLSTYNVGVGHGTVGILVNNVTIEHTTFRSDVNTDGRHADVMFTNSIYKDAQRRDFTMNALYAVLDANVDSKYYILNVYDIFGGISDMTNGVLNTVGNAHDRFREDGLRVIRALRFSAKYELQLSDEILRSLSDRHFMFELSNKISDERIIMELKKVLSFPFQKRKDFYHKTVSVGVSLVDSFFSKFDLSIFETKTEPIIFSEILKDDMLPIAKDERFLYSLISIHRENTTRDFLEYIWNNRNFVKQLHVVDKVIPPLFLGFDWDYIYISILKTESTKPPKDMVGNEIGIMRKMMFVSNYINSKKTEK